MDKKQYNKLKEEVQYDYVKFCKCIRIPCRGTQVRYFRDVAEPWQWRDAEIFSSVMSNLWNIKPFPIKNIWLTRPRGHDKTSSIARLALWAILFQRPNVAPLNIYVAAVDREQAGILLDSLKELVYINFPKLVSLPKSIGIAQSYGGRLHILSSDASSSYGLRANVLIFDELTHWESRGSKKFFDALWSGKSKMQNCITIVITNSGYKDTWQYNLLCDLKKSHDWYIYDEPGRLASWHGDLEDTKKGLSEAEVRRLLYNEWVEHNVLVLYDKFMSCICGYDKVPDDDKCNAVVIGVDYASSRDLTAISVVKCSGGRLYVSEVFAGHYKPESLERKLVDLWKRYVINCPVYIVSDRYQMEYMQVKMKESGIHMDVITPNSSYNKKALHNLVSLFQSKRILFAEAKMGSYASETLEDEMKNIVINIETGKVRCENSHDDRFHSLMYAINKAVQEGMIKSGLEPMDFLPIPRNNERMEVPFLSHDFISKMKKPSHNIFGLSTSVHDNDLERRISSVISRLEIKFSEKSGGQENEGAL